MDRSNTGNASRSFFAIAQRFTTLFMATMYGGGLSYIFFFARRRREPLPKPDLNLVPFRDKILYWQTTAAHTRPEQIEFYKDLVGNVLLFIPFPFFLAYCFGTRSLSRLLLISTGTSFMVELLQYLFRIGVADIDDLLLNTAGAFTGILIMQIISSNNNTPYRLSHKWRTVDEW